MIYDNMIELRSRLLKINAGSVLDVACGKGDFLKFILKSFNTYSSAVAIDKNIESLEHARKNLFEYPVSFVIGNVLSMPFLDKSFMTVTLSNSLHHIEDHEKLFTELIRVCRPDGIILVNEMITDNPSVYQESHMLHHHFIAELDNLLGQYHRETFSEKEIHAIVKELNLNVKEFFVHEDNSKDYFNQEEINHITEEMYKKVALLKNTDSYYFYLNKAQDIEKKIKKTGIKKPRHLTLIINPRHR